MAIGFWNRLSKEGREKPSVWITIILALLGTAVAFIAWLVPPKHKPSEGQMQRPLATTIRVESTTGRSLKGFFLLNDRGLPSQIDEFSKAKVDPDWCEGALLYVMTPDKKQVIYTCKLHARNESEWEPIHVPDEMVMLAAAS